MTVEIPTSGGRIEAELMPNDDPSVPLAVKLGKSGHVIYALPAMLKMGFRIVECSPAELAIMESHGITLTANPPGIRADPMTDEELEAEREAILDEERSLLETTERLRATPHDRKGHAAHHKRLQAHLARVHAYRDALRVSVRRSGT
jgi:hypothetical protein